MNGHRSLLVPQVPPLLTFCPACKVNVWTAAYVQHLAYHSMLLRLDHWQDVRRRIENFREQVRTNPALQSQILAMGTG